jgi:hypothetical protein
MSSGESDAIKYQPVVGKIEFQGLKYRDLPIRPENVHPDDRIPFILAEDQALLIEIIENWLSEGFTTNASKLYGAKRLLNNLRRYKNVST